MIASRTEKLMAASAQILKKITSQKVVYQSFKMLIIE